MVIAYLHRIIFYEINLLVSKKINANQYSLTKLALFLCFFLQWLVVIAFGIAQQRWASK